MKKRLSVIVIAMVLMLCVVVLAACNNYTQKPVAGGDATAAVESNGGFVVKQGNHIYFVNGYVGDTTENKFGDVLKQSIVRCTLNADGSVNNDSAVVIAPINVYNGYTKGVMAIYGEWIYYPTVNLDKNRYGTASTTDTDFMRTKIDGSVTQKIGTVKSRSYDYLFTENRVLYYTSNTVYYMDFSNAVSKKATLSGVTSGTLLSNVTSIKWGYNLGGKIYYTTSLTGDDSYKNYNELYSINIDGTGKELLASTPEQDVQHTYKYTLIDTYVEADGTTTLYYTKSIYLSETDTNIGLFCAKASNVQVSEKQLNAISSTTIYPLGYSDGALAYNNDSVYCWYNGEDGNAEDPIQVSTTSQTVVFADGTYAYIVASSSAASLLKIKYKEASNVETVLTAGIEATKYGVEFIGKNFYFFASNDNNYVHYVDITNIEDASEDSSTMIGIYLEKDIPSEDEE